MIYIGCSVFPVLGELRDKSSVCGAEWFPLLQEADHRLSVVRERDNGFEISPGIVGGVSSQKNCRFSGHFFHHSQLVEFREVPKFRVQPLLAA